MDIAETVPSSFSNKHIGSAVKSVYSDTSKSYPSYLEDRKQAMKKKDDRSETKKQSANNEEDPSRGEVQDVMNEVINQAIGSSDPSSVIPIDDEVSKNLGRNQARRLARVIKHPSMSLKFTETPPSRPPEIPVKRRNQQKFDKVKSVIEELFNIRPIWLRKHLLLHPILAMNQNYFREVLVMVAYCYSSGPYKGCLVRYGYHPIEDPASRIYTVISCRFRLAGDSNLDIKIVQTRIINHVNSIFKSSSQRLRVDLDRMEVQALDNSSLSHVSGKKITSAVEIFIFGVELTSQISVDIPSLRTEELFQLVCHYRRMPSCSQFTGWLSKEMLKHVRISIYEEVVQRVESFLAIPKDHLQLQAVIKTDANPNQYDLTLPSRQLMNQVYEDLFHWQDRYAASMNDQVVDILPEVDAEHDQLDEEEDGDDRLSEDEDEDEEEVRKPKKKKVSGSAAATKQASSSSSRSFAAPPVVPDAQATAAVAVEKVKAKRPVASSSSKAQAPPIAPDTPAATNVIESVQRKPAPFTVAVAKVKPRSPFPLAENLPASTNSSSSAAASKTTVKPSIGATNKTKAKDKAKDMEEEAQRWNSVQGFDVFHDNDQHDDDDDDSSSSDDSVMS
jgi:hypothetical protein